MPTPDVTARARINALLSMAKVNAINTGADPAEAAMDLICAAAALVQGQGTKEPVVEVLTYLLADSCAVAADWFPVKPYRPN